MIHVGVLQKQQLFEIHMAATQKADMGSHGGVMRRVEKGEVDIRAKHSSGSGVTALHCAAGMKEAPLANVAFLLERGADPLKQSCYFEEEELVDAFEIALESLDMEAFMRSCWSDSRLKSLAETKLELMFRAHEKAHGVKLPEVYFASVSATTSPVPLLLSPEIRVKRCMVGQNCGAILTDGGCFVFLSMFWIFELN
jgi:hypothetical protein